MAVNFDKLDLYKRELIRGQIAQIPSLKHVLNGTHTDAEIETLYNMHKRLRLKGMTTQVIKQLIKTSLLQGQNWLKDKIPLIEKIPFNKIKIELTAEEQLAIVAADKYKHSKPPNVSLAVAKAMLTDMIGDSSLEFIQQSLEKMNIITPHEIKQEPIVEPLKYTNDFQDKLQATKIGMQTNALANLHFNFNPMTNTVPGKSETDAYDLFTHALESAQVTETIETQENDTSDVPDVPEEVDEVITTLSPAFSDEYGDDEEDLTDFINDTIDQLSQASPAPSTAADTSEYDVTDEWAEKLAAFSKPALPRGQKRK